MQTKRMFRISFVLIAIILLVTVCAIGILHSLLNTKKVKNFKALERSTLLESDAELIYRRVRIHCIIDFSYIYTDWAVSIKRTWARHCNRVLFVGGDSHGELEPYVPKVNASETWLLVRMGLIYAYTYERDEADWFLQVHDASFVIVENLRQMLQNYSTNTAIYFGYKLKDSNGMPFMFGRSGIVLSKEALRRFVEIAVPNATLCNSDQSENMDIDIARCLLNVGVIAGDSRDELGRHTFMPFPFETLRTDKFLRKNPWFASLTYYDLVNNTLPISKHAIAFNVHSPAEFYSYYYFIYKVKNFGLQRRTTTSFSSRQNALSGVLSVPPYA